MQPRGCVSSSVAAMLARAMAGGTPMLSTRNQAIAMERDAGDTLARIAQRHGVSHQRVSAIAAQATEFVDRVELDLMVARKTGEACAYVIPFGPDYTAAVAFGDWLVARL